MKLHEYKGKKLILIYNMEDIMWTNKYNPHNSENLVSHKKAIDKINNWLKNYNKKKEKANLIIIGYHGIGKTTIANILLKEHEYIPSYLDFNKIKNNKHINEYISSLTKGQNISNIMCKNIQEKRALVIDEIETITSTIEKKALETLRKNNEKNRYLPIIFISDNQHNKFLTSLKKNCTVVLLHPPKNHELMKILENIIDKENIFIVESDVKEKIVKHSQGDIRRLINIVQDIHFIFKDRGITNNMLNKYLYNSKEKEIDIGLFDAAKYVFNNFKNVDDSLKLYEIQKTHLPLMMHEHYYKHILARCTNKKDKIKTLKKISELLSYGDFTEYHIYNNQDWDMQEFHGFYTCAATSFHINSINKKEQIYETYDFPQDLNKTSIKKINRKNVLNVEKKIKNLTIYDYIHMNQIIKKLLIEQNNEEIGNKLKDYGVSGDQIDSLLKIDKIKKTKDNGLSTKNKKKIASFLHPH